MGREFIKKQYLEIMLRDTTISPEDRLKAENDLVKVKQLLKTKAARYRLNRRARRNISDNTALPRNDEVVVESARPPDESLSSISANTALPRNDEVVVESARPPLPDESLSSDSDCNREESSSSSGPIILPLPAAGISTEQYTQNTRKKARKTATQPDFSSRNKADENTFDDEASRPPTRRSARNKGSLP